MANSRCCEYCGKAQVIQKQKIRYGNMLYQHSQVTEKYFDTFNFSVGKETAHGYEHTADLALSSPHQEEYVEPETCTTATQYSTSHMKITDSNPSLYNSWQDAEKRLVTDISRDPNTRLPNVPVRRRKKRTVKCKCSPESPERPITCQAPPPSPAPPNNSVVCICPPLCQTMTSLQMSTLQMTSLGETVKKRKFSWSILGLRAPDPVICGCYVRKTEAMTNLRNWNYLKRDPYMTKIICKCKPPKPRRLTVVDVPPLPKPRPPPPPPKRPTKVEEPVKIPEAPVKPEKEVKIERKIKPKQPKPKKKQPNETKPPKKVKEPPKKVKEPPKKVKEPPKPVPGYKRVSLNLGGILLKERRVACPITICDCCCPRKCLPPFCFYSKCDVCPYYSYFCF